MRVARMAAVVALALVLAGCTKSSPAITDAQVDGWRAFAAETIPDATEITIEATSNATMAGAAHSIKIKVDFATFADLKANERAVIELDKTVKAQSGGTLVSTKVVNDDATLHAGEVSAALTQDVAGLASVAVFEGDYDIREDTRLTMVGSVRLYLEDPSVLDPAWLDRVADISQAEFTNVSGHLQRIWILPADAVDLELMDPAFDMNLIRVNEIQAFIDFGVDDGCVRTDSWAYDLSNNFVVAYPASDPGGACS